MLLLDEPTLGLAPVACRQVFDLLSRINADGLTIVLAEQDVRAALSLARSAYVIEHGAVALSGPAGELSEDQRVRRAYIGL
jgi:branched-chain amino acid transport system ATP-binding protein